MMAVVRWLVVALCAALATALAVAMLQLDEVERVAHLSALVAARLTESGVEHPVTAVLLNFRAYDTLLEVAVLLIALLGMPAGDRDREPPRTAPPDAVLAVLARMVAPLAVMVAGYLLWAGALRAGGAFQAGAVLAAGAVLLRLAGLVPRWTRTHQGLRAAQAAGVAVFLAIAAGTGSALLHFPPAWAGPIIMGIEASLTVSLALILAALFIGAPDAGADETELR